MKKPKNEGINKKHIIFITGLFLILFILFFSHKLLKTSPSLTTEEKLIGVWQDMPSVAAGWSNRYHFFPNGRYEYVTSQMDCGITRERQHSGEWAIKDGILKLGTTMSLMWTGGEYIEGTGSCGTKELVNYDITYYSVEDIGSELESHHIGINLSFTTDNLGGHSRLKFNLDGKDFWKFSDNPNDDSPAPIGSNIKSDGYINDF